MQDELEPSTGAAKVNPVTFALTAVLRYHLLVILAVGVGLAVGLFRAVVTPNAYRSVGKLFVQPGILENLTVESAISGGSNGPRMIGTREAISNELQVLSSIQLFEKVVKRLGAETLLAPYDPVGDGGGTASWTTRLFHGFQTWWFQGGGPERPAGFSQDYLAALMLQDSVVIFPEGGASVLNIIHHADSAAKAKKVVDAVLEAAIDTHAEVFSTKSSLDKVVPELGNEEATAREAEKRLSEFRLEREVYDFESQREELISDLASLGRECDTIDLEIRRRQAETDRLKQILATVPEKRPIDGQITPNPEYARLTSLIGQLQMQELQIDLAKATGGDTRAYDEQKKVLSKLMLEAKTSLQQEAPTFPAPMIDHPRRERIVQLLDEAEVALDGLKQARTQRGLARTERREKLRSFDAMLPDLQKLELEAAQRRAASDSLAAGVANLQSARRLEQLNLSNVRILHGGGTFEPNKVAPLRSRLLGFGAVGGGACGLMLALLLAFLDRSVRSPLDLSRAGIPAGLVSESRASTVPPLHEGRSDAAMLWAQIDYDRHLEKGIKIALLPAGVGADAASVAADVAAGVARHGGEKVVLVSCVADNGAFESAAGLPSASGWRDVMRGELSLAAALQTTSVPRLQYLAMGSEGEEAISDRGFVELLDRLCIDHKVIVVQLPDAERQPSALAVLREVEGVLLAVRQRTGMRAHVATAAAAVQSSGAQLLSVVLQPEAVG